MQVFEEAHSILQREGYRDLLPHVTIVRIPPCDQVGTQGIYLITRCKKCL